MMSITGKIKSLKETLRDFYKKIRYWSHNIEFIETVDEQVTYDINFLKMGRGMALEEGREALYDHTKKRYENNYCPPLYGGESGKIYYEDAKLTEKSKWIYFQRRIEIDAALYEISEHHR